MSNEASKALEEKLKKNLEKRLAPRGEAYGNVFLFIAPILIEVLQKIMEGCNNTPERAVKSLKRGNPWAKANIRRGVRGRHECDDCRPECIGAVDDTIEEATEEELVAVFKDQQDNEVDWNHSPV